MFNLSCTYPCAVWRSVVAFRHFAMVQSAAMLTVHLACHQVRTIALILPLLHVAASYRQHGVGFLPDFLAYNRRNNALILKHHPLRFRFEDHFLGKHVLRSNFIATEISLVFRISDDMRHRRVGQFIAIIYRYVTEKSFDSYLWQTIENKQRFISQIMSSKSPVRACDDVDETALSYAEIKALCAGDPRIKEKMDLDIEVAKLRLMKADYQSNRFKLEDQILKQYPEEIRQVQERAKGYRADMALLEAHPLPKDGFVGMAIKGKRIADKEAAGKMLREACRLSPHDMELGEYRGMKMTVDYDSYRQEVKLILRGEMSHTVTMGTDVYGNLTRIENALANMPQKLEKAEERIAELERQTEQAKAELGKPFAQEKELEAKSARLAELNAALNIDEKRKEPMEKRSMKDVLKAYQERADAQSQEEKGGTNEWNR